MFVGQFGLLVGYLLPGFLGLLGLAPISPVVAGWIQGVKVGDAGVGPPIYAVLCATMIGMIVGCFRWLIVDHVHEWTGIKRPTWDFNVLEKRLKAFNYIVEGRYRYYQFYSGTLIALVWTYSVYRLMQTSPLLGIGTDLGVLILCAVLFAGSRDALRRYYAEVGQLVGPVAEKGRKGDDVTNGYHHEAGSSSKPKSESKPGAKTVAPAKAETGKSGESPRPK
jgi:hypothetical protein